ncbi:PAAR domain-containing protein [Pseudomonas sp. CDFA 553]|uniref:PAAR domain-containing protein n=1 Tax=Pseudomonas quasicaspiana TaxID=2829821 RepID=UPI001E6088D9|nr:PAAR domain-containing protein [Pseudomonas quasicaspiana]MCD5988610.1 PAAR domain-containing protein [Pseudomonas quasicaspiana]
MSYVVREDDPTTTGGFVLSASATQLMDLRRLARMGDPVWCPACETVGYIAQGNPTFIDEYIAVATHGHNVKCECDVGSHQLIATQQTLAADMDAAIDIPKGLAKRARLVVDKMNAAVKEGVQPGDLMRPKII